MVKITRHSIPSLRLDHARDFLRQRKAAVLVVGALLALCIAIVIMQLLYAAPGRALPFVSIDGQSVGGQQVEKIERDIQKRYGSAALQVTIRDKKIDTTLLAAGLGPDVNTLTQQVSDYPLWQRFIPFSILKFSGVDYKVIAQLDEERFSEFAKTIIPLCEVNPSDATVASVDGKLQLTPARAGAKCTIPSLHKQFIGMPLVAKGNTKRVEASTVEPSVSTESARQLLVRAQAIIDGPLTLQLMGGIDIPEKATIADWLTFEPDAVTNQPAVAISSDEVTAYLRSLQDSIYIAPGTTVVNLRDGVEVSRVAGAAGRGIDMVDGVKRITQQLLAGGGRVDLQLAALKPLVQYNRSYSRTNEGLQALLSYLVEQKGDFAISVRQLDGARLSADARGGTIYTPASTYKLFVAYAVLKRIESGQMRWDDQAVNGRTVAACFDTMIIHSDNPCAEWFGQTIGWRTITDMLRAMGLSSATSLNTPRGFEATANDEVTFLAKLQSGQILSPTSTERLLDVMKRQIYRSGIPAGAGGLVADKVGFLDGLLHDAAIVYAPSGTYVVVIMSNGSSWGQIADAARQINNWLN